MSQLPRLFLPEDGLDLFEVDLSPPGLPCRVEVNLEVVAAGENSWQVGRVLVADLACSNGLYPFKVPAEQLFLDAR